MPSYRERVCARVELWPSRHPQCWKAPSDETTNRSPSKVVNKLFTTLGGTKEGNYLWSGWVQIDLQEKISLLEPGASVWERWLFPTSDLRVKSGAAWGSPWGPKQTRNILLLAPSHKQVTAEEIWRIESCRKLLPDKSRPSEPTPANSSRLLLRSLSGPKGSLSLYQLLKSSLHTSWGHA